MSRRPVLMIAIVTAAGLVVASACAPDTRDRMLRFFIDGVPEPGVQQQVGYTPVRIAAPMPSALSAAAPNAPLFSHTPYRQDRCDGCHSFETGGLVRSLDDGLCLNCHAPLITKVKYAHGPAAVGDCTFCHHYHASRIENQLLFNLKALCAQCHETDDLTTGPHHAAIATQTCTNCHDPHGSGDRYFLKRTEQ